LNRRVANRPPRFPDFDYAGFNRYFITICVDSRTPVFREIAHGEIVATRFLQIATRNEFEAIAYCVMPDHFHALVGGESEQSFLEPFLNRFKQATGYWWKHDLRRRHRLWQEGYFDRILRDDDPTEGVVRYIVENPIRAGIVDDAREYPLTGAAKYDINELLECAMLWTPPWKMPRARRRV
jgi:putative transposase